MIEDLKIGMDEKTKGLTHSKYALFIEKNGSKWFFRYEYIGTNTIMFSRPYSVNCINESNYHEFFTEDLQLLESLRNKHNLKIQEVK